MFPVVMKSEAMAHETAIVESVIKLHSTDFAVVFYKNFVWKIVKNNRIDSKMKATNSDNGFCPKIASEMELEPAHLAQTLRKSFV